jgi:hypothetical protein
MTKTFIMISMIAGSYAGSYIPTIWGDSFFSIASIFFSAFGGLAGIYLGFALSKRLE